jgi:hypothetical protein
MPEYEVDGVRAVYDHETEDPRSGARRRPVADWGVGEELFDHMPRRRFGRPSDPHRRDSHPRERGASARAEDFLIDDEPAGRDERRSEERRPADRDERRPADRDAADRLAAAPTEDLGAPVRTTAPAEATAEAGASSGASASRSAAERQPEVPGAEPARPAARADSIDGRRTIVIGRSVHGDTLTRRPRRPRTVGERVGHRPDRMAMWAVALGLLLILIAILTAGA